jgi:ABC-type branched-subunit amino acid transport system ATPase component
LVAQVIAFTTVQLGGLTAAEMPAVKTAELAGFVERLNADGTTVLLVEHDMGFVMGVSDSVAVLNFGRLIFQGSPQATRSADAVIEAYLGARLAAQLKARHG